VAVLAGFVQSLAAGIILIVFFVVYQQLENHVLQPVIFSRTVALNPLTALLAVLLGVELAGILGALLAIPVAGILQIVARDVWDGRRGRLKPVPTVGPDEVPTEPVSPDDERAEPVGPDDKRAEPVGPDGKPAEPVGLDEKPDEPGGPGRQRAEPVGPDEKPAEPSPERG
jgi:hypothetical protein